MIEASASGRSRTSRPESGQNRLDFLKSTLSRHPHLVIDRNKNSADPMRIFILITLFLLTAPTYAFDSSNAGQYAMVHRDGYVTNKVLRVVHSNNRWKIEDRKENGTWDDVTCEKGCKLSVSKKTDVEYFMGGKAPKGLSAECINNQAFAFCAISKVGESRKRYLFVALVQQGPIPISLVRTN
jgi:hypothetical protein